MIGSGTLAPLAPTWGDEGLVLVIPKHKAPQVAGGLLIMLTAVALLALDALFAGVVLFGVAALMIGEAQHRPQLVLRLSREVLRIGDLPIRRSDLRTIGVSDDRNVLLLHATLGEQRVALPDAETMRSLARLLRAWKAGRTEGWGGPAFFDSLQPSTLDDRGLDALAPLDARVGELGIQVTLLRRRPGHGPGLLLGTLALPLACAVFIAAPLTGIPGLHLGFVDLDPLALLLLFVAAGMVAAGTVVEILPRTTRDLELTPHGLRSESVRMGYADVEDLDVSGPRLLVRARDGRSLTLFHPDADALLELRERVGALCNAASRHDDEASRTALARLMGRSAVDGLPGPRSSG